MTYTSGYQSQNSGASVYSPFNRSGAPAADAYAGYPAAVPTNTYGAAQQPSQGISSDVFLPPSNSADIDSLSSSIDSKIAQIRQAFSQGAPTAPAGPQAPAAAAVPDADIQWALQLEQKVKTQNYQPTQQETARYEDIAKRLQAAQAAPQQPAAQPQAPAAAAVPDADIQWALQLEQKVKTQNYQPTQQETARYEDIAKRLQAAQAAPQQPAAQPQAPAAAAVPDADIQWALQLEQKVKTQNYQPTQQETARYQDIAQRLQAAQAAPQQPAAQPQAPAGQQNWSDWSKPFTVPAAPTMPLPIAGPNGQPVMSVPTSLRGAPQSPPAAMLNQPPGTQMQPQQPQQPQFQAQQPAANVSQQEIQWALALEQKVNGQNYQPTPQEMQQYQSIAQRLQASQQQPAAQPQQPAMPPQQPAMQPQFQAQQPAMQPQQPAMQPQPPQYQAQQPQQSLPANISQQEVQWALDLEQRVKTQNYQPTAQETANYQSIAQRLQAAQQQPQQPAMPPQQPQFQAQQPQQFQQPGLPQYQAPQPVPQQVAPSTQQVPIIPQSYPMVQAQTPQYVVPPQVQAPQNYQPMPQQMGPQQGFQQQQGPQAMPSYMGPPGQSQQKPGFMDKLKTAWSTLWS